MFATSKPPPARAIASIAPVSSWAISVAAPPGCPSVSGGGQVGARLAGDHAARDDAQAPALFTNSPGRAEALV